MASTDKPPQPPAYSERQWKVSYTQRDVDTIREQIEQGEGAKRRFLVHSLVVTGAALAGSLVLLSTGYALYDRSQSARSKLTNESAALKSKTEQCEQQLDALRAEESKKAETRAAADARLRQVLPAVLRSEGGSEGAVLAQMVYRMPDHMVTVDQKPPDSMFHNWKMTTDQTTEVYTLVGGFVGGKWVIYSNLVGRR